MKKWINPLNIQNQFNFLNIQKQFHLLNIQRSLNILYLPSELVEDGDVGVHEVEIVTVGWVLILAPILGEGRLQVKLDVLCFGFIINRIKSTHLNQMANLS